MRKNKVSKVVDVSTMVAAGMSQGQIQDIVNLVVQRRFDREFNANKYHNGVPRPKNYRCGSGRKKAKNVD